MAGSHRFFAARFFAAGREPFFFFDGLISNARRITSSNDSGAVSDLAMTPACTSKSDLSSPAKSAAGIGQEVLT